MNYIQQYGESSSGAKIRVGAVEWSLLDREGSAQEREEHARRQDAESKPIFKPSIFDVITARTHRSEFSPQYVLLYSLDTNYKHPRRDYEFDTIIIGLMFNIASPKGPINSQDIADVLNYRYKGKKKADKHTWIEAEASNGPFIVYGLAICVQPAEKSIQEMGKSVSSITHWRK